MFGISLDGMIFVSFLSAQLIHRQKRKKKSPALGHLFIAIKIDKF